jgi:hypothetical protein
MITAILLALKTREEGKRRPDHLNYRKDTGNLPSIRPIPPFLHYFCNLTIGFGKAKLLKDI